MRVRKELVMLDTCVFGWAIRDPLAEKDRNKKLSAIKLVENLEKNGAEIVLPTIVLFELLSVFGEEDEEDRKTFLKEMINSFKIYDYGVQCANIGSYMIQAKKKHSKSEDFEGYRRSKLTIDLMILGTALSHNITKLYTDNIKDFRKLEKLIPQQFNNHIEIKELPENIEQEISF